MSLKNYSIRRILCSILGVAVLSFGISICKGSLLGMDTYTGMNTAVSNYIGISLGNYQLVLNIVLLISMVFFGRHLLGLGTVINMVFVGYLVDFFLNIFKGTFISADEEKTFLIKIILLVVGAIILCLGASLYMTADLGVSPYDALAIMINNHVPRISFKIARIGTDLVCVIVGLVFGTVLGNSPFGTIVGIGTVLTAFGTGPFIEFFNKTISKLLVGETK